MEKKKKGSEGRRCEDCRWYDGWYEWGQCLWWFINDPLENHPMPVKGDSCCRHWESDGRDRSACGPEDETDGRNT